jgi:hypothetical protein
MSTSKVYGKKINPIVQPCASAAQVESAMAGTAVSSRAVGRPDERVPSK